MDKPLETLAERGERIEALMRSPGWADVEHILQMKLEASVALLKTTKDMTNIYRAQAAVEVIEGLLAEINEARKAGKEQQKGARHYGSA